MQIKIEPMKNTKTERKPSERDQFRHINKAKAVKRKVARQAKRFTQAA